MAALCLVIVEDDSDYAWLVGEMLRDASRGSTLEVTTFGSVAELRAGAEGATGAECALVDLSLPDAHGLEIIDAVHEALPGVPIVVLTGAEDEGMALQAVERGAQDYLVKRRVEPDTLGRAVRYAIERSRAERQRSELLQARAAHAEAEALSGTLRRLQAVADAAITYTGRRGDPEELLDRALAVIAAEAGALIVRDPASGEFGVAGNRGLPLLTGDDDLEEDPVIGPLLSAAEPSVLGELEGGTLLASGMHSLVAVPMDRDDRRLGLLLAASALPARFSDEQGRLLALAGERCARGLAQANAYERERRTSAALQAGLLPQAVPPLEQGEIAVRFLPAQGGPAVGGDWYDAFVLADGRVGVAIGDVTGHGAEAAVLMGQLRTALRAFALDGAAPRAVATRLNALALSLGDAAIATLIYFLFEPDLSRGTYVNAGHPPPILVSHDGAEKIVLGSSAPAGVTADATFDEHEVTLTAGDAICLYSDGLIEEREAVFAEREASLLKALGQPAGAEILCERALAALRPDGAGRDDVALLVLRAGAPAQALRSTHRATPDSLGEARRSIGAWLDEIGASPSEKMDVLMASNEACMNVVEHAYQDGRGDFTLEGHLDRETVVVIVRDAGRWSEVQSRDRGRGLKLMEALMDSVQLSFSAEGTMVVLRRTLGAIAA